MKKKFAIYYFKVDTHEPAGNGSFVLSLSDAEQVARDHSDKGTYAVVKCKEESDAAPDQ